MIESVFIMLLGIAFGAIGYLITTFWMRPILRYKTISSQVAADLVFFANAIELQKTDGSFRNDALERKNVNRRCAADLMAIQSELPSGYRCWLNMRGQDPEKASTELIGLSNVSGGGTARPHIDGVKNYLKLPLKRS